VEDRAHQDISFLARELNQSTEAIIRVAISARLAAAYQDIPAPAFYAFLRQRVPANLPSPLLDATQSFTLADPLVKNIASLIFGLSGRLQSETLTSAVALGFIGQRFTAEIPHIVADLAAHHVDDLLGQPYMVGSTTLGQLLDRAGVASSAQKAFAQALATNTKSMRAFWRSLGKGSAALSASEASTIERTLSIGAFVKNYPPLVQNLLEGFSSGTYKTTADLARLSLQDWVDLVNQAGPPPGVDGTATASAAEVFARVVYTRATRAYPTAALSSRIVTGNFVPRALKEPLSTFFADNPELELLTHSIPAYLNAHSTAMQGGRARSTRRSGRRAPELPARPACRSPAGRCRDPAQHGPAVGDPNQLHGEPSLLRPGHGRRPDQARSGRGLCGRVGALRPTYSSVHQVQRGRNRVAAPRDRRSFGPHWPN
jgi:hypothetical protein